MSTLEQAEKLAEKINTNYSFFDAKAWANYGKVRVYLGKFGFIDLSGATPNLDGIKTLRDKNRIIDILEP